MAWARRLWLKLQSLFRLDRNAKRLDDEIEFHLDQQIAENIAAGMSPQEARYAAMRTFGNPTILKEETRDTWGWVVLEPIGKDFRYGTEVTPQESQVCEPPGGLAPYGPSIATLRIMQLPHVGHRPLCSFPFKLIQAESARRAVPVCRGFAGQSCKRET